MTFLNPLVLIGLVAAAIPLIIHLFNFRRPKKIDFSSLQFLRELQKSTMQRVRVKQWLLLLLRTLALASLILAFARPALKGGWAASFMKNADTSIGIVIDNSQSMGLRDAQGDFLTQARDIAYGIINRMQDGDQVFLVTTAEKDIPPSVPIDSRSEALDELGDITLDQGAVSLQEALLKASERLQDSNSPNKEIYLFSDLQKSTLLDSLATPIAKGIHTMLFALGSRTYNNVAVSSVDVVSRIVEKGQPVKLRASLTNYGSENAKNYAASVYLDGIQVSQGTAEISPGASAVLELPVVPSNTGWLSGSVEIEPDEFEFDDKRFFTLFVPEVRKILLVQGSQQDSRYTDLVFSPKMTEGRVRFDIRKVNEGAVVSNPLDEFDAVLLVGVQNITEGERQALTRFTQGGGGLLVFPATMPSYDSYNKLLEALKGGSVKGYQGKAGSRASAMTLGRFDREHALFSGVLEQAHGISSKGLEQLEIFSSVLYEPGNADEQTIINLSNGSPFLQEIHSGQGSVLFFTVPLNPSYSDLPVRGLFIPLIYRSFYYLSSSSDLSGEGLITGSTASIIIPGVREGEISIKGPDGSEFIPESRNLYNSVLLTLDSSLRNPGVYDVFSGDKLVRRFALNTDSRESNLERYNGREAANLLSNAVSGNVKLISVGGTTPERLINDVQQERTGIELWNVFMILALLFLLAEMIVARQWRPESVAA